MNKGDAVTFARILDGLAEVYGEDVGEMRKGIYLRAMQALDIRAIQYAAGEHVQRSKFFPKPAELLELGRMWKRPALAQPPERKMLETREQQKERMAESARRFREIRESIEALDDTFGTNLVGTFDEPYKVRG
jgi:hypothetical protein